MTPRGQSDEALETGFVDLNVARCGRDDLAAIDQEGLGGIGSDRDLARDGNGRSLEHSTADFDAARIFGIKSVPPAKIEQSRFEPALLFRKRAAAGR